jgi:dTMP kinase
VSQIDRVAGSEPPSDGGVRGGLFLAFEGVEGSGKSTQATLLATHLREQGVPVVHAREPGSTPLGERIRALVLNDASVQIPPLSELFLMLAARAAFVEQVVRPALAENRVVISDRFELSTLVYQGVARGLRLDDVTLCNRIATTGLSPHATLLLEVTPEEGILRQLAAGKRPDRMEGEGRDFHERVARGYVELAASIEQVIRIDARGTVEEVRARVLSALGDRFPETFAGTGFIR